MEGLQDDLFLFVMSDYSELLFPYLLGNAQHVGASRNYSGNRRRWWVRPWIKERENQEHNNAFDLQNELIAFDDTAEFRAMLRLDQAQYTQLPERIRPVISKRDTQLRKAIAPEVRLSITLKYLATGESWVSLSQQYRVGRSTVGKIVKETCVAIYHVMKDEYLTTPNDPEVWASVADVFWERWNFPNCVGALDGKHMAIYPPANSGSLYYNYKGRFSLVMLALVDANYEFLYIDVGAEGRAGDSGVWNRSSFTSAMEDGTLGLPGPKVLPGTNVFTPNLIVGDDAFKLTPSLMKPYSRRQLTSDERIFNYHLSRARRVSENAFGILANRFRAFLKPMHVHPDTATDVILAACALHNYLRREVGQGYVYLAPKDQQENMQNANSAGTLLPMDSYRGHRWSSAAKKVRDDLASFMLSETGSVSWQRASVGLPAN